MNQGYYRTMPKARKMYLEIPLASTDEDEATLRAIEEGCRDAQAGRVVRASEVRKLVAQWIADAAKRP
jgi:predicted transcriptional regulator